MRIVSPYLNFNGNAEEAFNFYKSVFGGELRALSRFKDTPEADKLAPSDREKIMHVALQIGKETTLMGTDALESMGFHLTVGNNFSLAINVESEKEADDLFGKLSAGGTVELPMQDMFWGDYFGMLVDRFGVRWMVAFTRSRGH
jgi:PhnB protein